MTIDIHYKEKFESRHNSAGVSQIVEMLAVIGIDSLDQLIDQTVPERIRLDRHIHLPPAQSEWEYLKNLKKIAGLNKVYKSYIGMGYSDCYLPPVILRNILENPGWYTAYTPYQAEIAQGRMEALINFQTMIMDLTGMEIANASLLDEGTAAAEAMTMLYNLRQSNASEAWFFVSDWCHPQTIDVLRTRAQPLGIQVVVGNHLEMDLTQKEYFGVLLQYPGTQGEVSDYSAFIESAQEQGIFVAVAADLLSLCLLKPPGEMGADVVLGSSQRFGVPMGYGGPHAAFFATKDKFKRQIPGRIIGVSLDAQGNKAYRMALQTREQHIRREKATSNICTAQVLLAVIAGAYAVYHGPEGLKKIASRIYGLTRLTALALQKLGFEVNNQYHFDTLKIRLKNEAQKDIIRNEALSKEVNFRYFEDQSIGISLDEVKTLEDVQEIAAIFAQAAGASADLPWDELENEIVLDLPQNLIRQSEFMSHPVFNRHHTEHAMLRYLKSLENKDLSLAHSMIPLGSCTMKLNATAEMIPVTWPEFGALHPFAPQDQTQGYAILFEDLEKWLCEVTGFAAMSLQPNSGAQGEYAGLLTIRNYHLSRGEVQRNIALIPSSAHGTNPASAVMVGMQVVVVRCDERGNIDVEDLKAKALQHKDHLAALMVTYPSTHGVFEEAIQEICQIIHECGGQVYMDGANMNAQVGLTSPARIGADVCHLNLHKTFCIPHGGGGPGMGPIGVAAHLIPFLPNHTVVNLSDSKEGPVSAAPWGSAGILPISHAYISMMGSEGLRNATELAILNANYILARLKDHYEILYTGTHGTCAHEFIIDCRAFKKAGVDVADIAKRLMDYGFHAPTVSFPVAGTMMIEPTESESKEELDRFCEAMISIRQEIKEVENGLADPNNNLIINAPHTASMIISQQWDKPYSRERAAYPLAFVKQNKFWPSVAKIDNAYGDRNLVCSCIPITAYENQEVSEETL
ncbi:MAG: aminomethyl-transferring glycine dehydrogenase [Microscillaceae bacterium]|nr:aminomethyl-transferring glycine dehydrogenase [Microscillaceae bacterium]